MKNEEDKEFLKMQQDPSSSSMAGIDQSLAVKETRKVSRNIAAANRKHKHETSMTEVCSSCQVRMCC